MKNKTVRKTREATKEDFKVGTTLISKIGGWEHTIREWYHEGIWNCNGNVVFENEARHYLVEIK